MRKEYEKPALYAESFQVVEHISANCNTSGVFQAQHSNGWMCAITWDDHGEQRVMFTNNISGCAGAVGEYDASWQDDSIMNDYYNDTCYNNMSLGQMLSS